MARSNVVGKVMIIVAIANDSSMGIPPTVILTMLIIINQKNHTDDKTFKSSYHLQER